MARLNLLLLAVFVAAILPAGCASNSVQVPKEVRVSVPVPCVDPAERPVSPGFRSLDDLLRMPTHDRTIATWADLRKYEAYTSELEAVVEGCSRLRAAP